VALVAAVRLEEMEQPQQAAVLAGQQLNMFI
jgi:hypothetical protein